MSDNNKDMEDEANVFAMEMLMPTKFLIKEIRAIGGVSIDDDEKMDRLARKFKVQQQILAVRILRLDEELRSGEHV